MPQERALYWAVQSLGYGDGRVILQSKKHESLSQSIFVVFRDRIITTQFMRKYLNIAKKIVPELTREAADYIAEEYSKLRNQENLQGDLARVGHSGSSSRTCRVTWLGYSIAHL